MLSLNDWQWQPLIFQTSDALGEDGMYTDMSWIQLGLANPQGIDTKQLLGCPGTEVIGSKVIGSMGYNPNISHV